MNSTKEQGSRKTAGKTNPKLAKIYRCDFTGNGYNTAMKKSLAHLPQYKQNELEQLAPCVKKLYEVTERTFKEKIESFG